MILKVDERKDQSVLSLIIDASQKKKNNKKGHASRTTHATTRHRGVQVLEVQNRRLDFEWDPLPQRNV